MIRNYLKIAVRNILKYRVFSVVNISGMAVSLACCLLISLFVWDELNYDQYQVDGDRIYRIYNESIREDGTITYLPIVPPTFGPFIEKDFPEVESTMRFMDSYGERLFIVGDKKFNERNGIFAEPNVFEMLGINIITGEPAKNFEAPNMLAISESMAEKYFGSLEALGKTIRVSDTDYDVVAVFKDIPSQSHLKLDFIISFQTMASNIAPERMESWRWQQFFTYVKLKPGTDPDQFESKLASFVEKYAYDIIKPLGFTYVPHLQNLRDIHLHSSAFTWEIAQRGNAESVYVLAATGLMILVIACLNFINLSTARAMKRIKEVGVRKTIGAQRAQLVSQFITESILYTLLGLLIAVGITQLAIPYLNDFIGKNLHLPLTFQTIGGIAVFSVLLGLLAGSYPAFHLAHFKPALVLAKKAEGGSGASLLRQSLVIVQFMFSFFLITGSWIILDQNDLLLNKDLGFNKDEVVVIPLQREQLQNFETTKQRFAAHPNVVSATMSYGLPGDIIAGDGVTDHETGKELGCNLFCVDFDYLNTMNMDLVAGRDFSQAFGTDPSSAFIVNEAFVDTYLQTSAKDAIGKRLDWPMWGSDSTKHGAIIGVVRDFHFKSLREKVAPAVIQIFTPAYYTLAIKIKPVNIPATIKHFEEIYASMQPDRIFTYRFLDENFEAMYKSEVQLSGLFSIFTGLAIMVACLGLFGLVEYNVNQRMKEISIRKVFGASVPSLFALLTRKYFAMITIAFLLIIPISYWMASQWLQNFAYRIEISPAIFVKAALLIAAITLATVSFQSIKAAFSNPANILKTE